MNKLLSIDKPYRDSLHATSVELQKAYVDALKNHKFDLNTTHITEAILERLKSFYLSEYATKDFLNKGVIPDAADYFVEATLFFLKLYFASCHPDIEVISEKSIERKRGSLRPDITIKQHGNVIAIIECKTQLGYNRNKWEPDFLTREQRLKEIYPNAKAYLLVSTSDNWGGFGDNARIRKSYYSLLGKGIRAYSYDSPSQILDPIEFLLKDLLSH